MQENENVAPGSPETRRPKKVEYASPLKRISDAPMASYQYGDEPEIVRFVRMCSATPRYHVLREDAFGIWPWRHGDGTPVKIDECVMTKAQVKTAFGIDLDI
jgi:hypothetical protein